MLYAGRIHWYGPVATIDDPGDAHVEQFVKGHAEGPIHVDVAAG
jgi:ABC-type transporter Mla maintaining outer membrane lipid asymmetry ATPase subunit MlaF